MKKKLWVKILYVALFAVVAVMVIYKSYGPLPCLPKNYDRVELISALKDGYQTEIELSDEQVNSIVAALASCDAASVKKDNPVNGYGSPQCRVCVRLRFWTGEKSTTRYLYLGVDGGKRCYIYGINSATGYGILENGDEILKIILGE